MFLSRFWIALPKGRNPQRVDFAAMLKDEWLFGSPVIDGYFLNGKPNEWSFTLAQSFEGAGSIINSTVNMEVWSDGAVKCSCNDGFGILTLDLVRHKNGTCTGTASHEPMSGCPDTHLAGIGSGVVPVVGIIISCPSPSDIRKLLSAS
jgi:hypothetical protein